MTSIQTITRALLFLLLVSSVARGVTETLNPSASAVATLAEAARALDAGDLDTAERLLTALLGQAPSATETASAHLGLSRILELRGDLPAALAQARRAEEVVPDNADTVFAVGRALARLGAAREASMVLERARRLAPDDPNPVILQALVLRDAEEVEEAVAVLEQAWVEGLRGPEVAEQLGALNLTLDRPSRTLEIVNEALEGSQDHPALVLLKGLALGKDVDARPEAIAMLRRALKLGAPDPGRVWLELAIMLLDEGDHEAALPALEEARALRPDDPEVFYRLGAAYRMAGNREGAVKALKRFQELRREADQAGSTSKRLGTELNRAHVLADEGRLAESLSVLDEILADAPGNARVHTSKAKILFSMGRIEDGLESIVLARQLDAGRSEHHFLEGVFLLELDRFAEAEAAARHALDLDPDLTEAHGLLAGALMKQNEPEEAAAHFSRALELGADSPSLRLGYAAALEATGRAAEAEAQMAAYRRLRGGDGRDVDVEPDS